MQDNKTPTCGWMIKHCIYPSAESVATGLATAILKAFDRAEMIDGPVAIMLAGGRTPKAAYEIVARSGRIIPENMTLMISDERWVPLDSPESNFLMMTPFMKAVKCAEIQKIMVNTALPREEAAKDFGRRLDSFFNRGGILLESFLGLGADGHTASLFSDDHLTMSQNTSAIAVDRPDGRVGISATASTIQKAQRVVFVVTGADKKNMADLLLTRPLDLTAGKVVFRHAHVELWRDKAAV